MNLRKEAEFSVRRFWRSRCFFSPPERQGDLGSRFEWQTQQAVIGDSYVLSPTTIVSVRASFLRNTSRLHVAQRPQRFEMEDLVGEEPAGAKGRSLLQPRYEDFAVSPSRFHWQSQSTTGEDSPTGRRYVFQKQNGTRFLLFVRPKRGDPFGFLGPLHYVSHTGSRPMSIYWDLERPMPAWFFEICASLRAA
jgi:hypothetical protein